MQCLFIGDSITEGFYLKEHFPGYEFINRGISGYSSEEIMKAISPNWFSPKPDRVFICAGTNDLARDIDERHILGNLVGISSLIWEMAGEDTKITITSLFPTRHNPPRPNAQIKALNEAIHSLSIQISVSYLHLHPFFTDVNGQLSKHFTDDGVHLTALAYDRWASLLRVYLNLE